MITADELFDLLDFDDDGELSRTDLHQAAVELGWHWHQAPLYAVLDHLTTMAPLPRRNFTSCMEQIANDPWGPYGKLLCRSPLHSSSPLPAPASVRPAREEAAMPDELPSISELIPARAATDYDALLDELAEPSLRLPGDDAALLIIDPQRSFTRGSWKRSIGANAENEVAPIRLAFASCARLIRGCHPETPRMFTRCPFPPASYDWDEAIVDAIDDDQLYFVKPGNSVLWPPTNGFREWASSLADRGKKNLVIAGCTFNSCVRVSAIETRELVKASGLQIIVDASSCGARASNYVRSPEFGGISSVESAVRQMVAAGVGIARGVRFTQDVQR